MVHPRRKYSIISRECKPGGNSRNFRYFLYFPFEAEVWLFVFSANPVRKRF
ncbi:hypothetical protein J6590_050233 [Homalodisca vitripennis]|nr:hypothetical protein J6590_050232 [Homalodisca vitripennis]KAG8252749.1 hypothetical protein J6590_050233 [Homalodisca vitripennis]